jgi:hypothetical protein
MEKRKKKELQIGDILKEWQFSPDREKSKKYVRFEFQDYGIRLAYKLNDIYHKSLYIRLAKTVKREYLDEAYRFAIDYPNMGNKNKGRIFMWALSKLRKGEKLYTKK